MLQIGTPEAKRKEEGQKEHHQGKLQISLPHLRRNYSESEKQCQKHGKKYRNNSDFRAKEYISVKGNTIKEKTLKLKDCSIVDLNVVLNVKDEQRLQIFQAFWSLENNERKKDFIVTNTNQKKTRTYIDEGNELVKKREMFIDRIPLSWMEADYSMQTFFLDDFRH
ncbi:unnamed protein product [Mytilus coruscus]|uniref:Uncharacterized protein n=1 Tax=Mytilus coruscus TaxID=42192 RepID=A0A6J8CSB3_MYTCO|nr:unnamed protein product [Mytilus coruscus]